MKFINFIKIYRKSPLIDSGTFSLYSPNPQDLRRQVREWVKKGYLLSLKRGIYIFSDEWRKFQISSLFIANYLISPSYISREYALGFYGLIPEKVTVFTSVTTKKTRKFKNILGNFEYSSIKKELFFGFKKETDNEQDIFISLPEKALLDYFYLNNHFRGSFSELESIRLQNLENLNVQLIKEYSFKFNKRVQRIGKILIKYIEKQKSEYERLY